MSDFEFAENPTEALLSAFRRHASGVAVITTVAADGSPVGFTATSMTSLGANPPLIMFSVARGASSWEAIKQAEFVAVHTLGAKNLELAKKMAADHTKRFAETDWKFGPEGLPVFDCATAILICKVRLVREIEQNAVVIADVVNGSVGEPDDALLYYQRGYHKPSGEI
ncbi:MAG: flavin reductase family protein [Micrococcales bacterium]